MSYKSLSNRQSITSYKKGMGSVTVLSWVELEKKMSTFVLLFLVKCRLFENTKVNSNQNGTN